MRQTVPIVCARAPRWVVYVPAVFDGLEYDIGPDGGLINGVPIWRCSFCGQRVKIVA